MNYMLNSACILLVISEQDIDVLEYYLTVKLHSLAMIDSFVAVDEKLEVAIRVFNASDFIFIVHKVSRFD